MIHGLSSVYNQQIVGCTAMMRALVVQRVDGRWSMVCRGCLARAWEGFKYSNLFWNELLEVHRTNGFHLSVSAVV
jgi:hypothetical protein